MERARAEKRRVVGRWKGRSDLTRKDAPVARGELPCVDQELVNTRRSPFTPEERFSSKPREL